MLNDESPTEVFSDQLRSVQGISAGLIFALLAVSRSVLRRDDCDVTVTTRGCCLLHWALQNPHERRTDNGKAILAV